MDRRGFLKLAPRALACGTTLGTPAAELAGGGEERSLWGEEVNAAPVEDFRFAAAVFPSKAWGVCGHQMHFSKGILADVDSDFPHEALIRIGEGRFDFNVANVPQLAIAVANPHDPASWRAAQAECLRAKKAGAVTLLFAAHPYPEYRYPFDARVLTYAPQGTEVVGVDVVIDFVTLNLREEFPRVVYALTHVQPSWASRDSDGFWQAIASGRRAIYFCDTAHGARRTAKATKVAVNQLCRLDLACDGFNGGLILVETNTRGINEFNEIYDRISGIVALGAPIFVGDVNHYDVDPWMTVHAIVTYESA